MNVWNDDPNEETVDEIAREIAPRLRLISQKTWVAEAAPAGYAEFQTGERRNRPRAGVLEFGPQWGQHRNARGS